jgi:hypothetical protein
MKEMEDKYRINAIPSKIPVVFLKKEKQKKQF